MNMTPEIMSETDIDAALFGMQKLGNDQSGWDALYADPATGKFWELTYPQSHLHGGGPRQLSEISSSAARVKYANARDWEKPMAYTKIVQRLNIRSCCPVCGTIGFDYQRSVPLVECPKCCWKGLLDDRDLVQDPPQPK
jgi:hypothetical protein